MSPVLWGHQGVEPGFELRKSDPQPQLMVQCCCHIDTLLGSLQQPFLPVPSPPPEYSTQILPKLASQRGHPDCLRSHSKLVGAEDNQLQSSRIQVAFLEAGCSSAKTVMCWPTPRHRRWSQGIARCASLAWEGSAGSPFPNSPMYSATEKLFKG